jgi:hypothetical protein
MHMYEIRILTFPEILRLLRDHPVATVNVSQLESREESSNSRQHLVRDIVALRSSHEQRRTFPPCLVRVGEWEVGHVVQRVRKVFDRNAPLHDPVRSSRKVGQKELANGHRLLIFLQDRICLALLLELCLFNPLHALGVLGEPAVQRSIDRRIVHADQGANGCLLAQCDSHSRLCAHRVSDQRAVLDVLLLQETFHVLGESSVVVLGMVRRVAMVAQIDRVDGAVQLAGKDSGRT